MVLVQLSNARNETLRVAYLETLPWFVTLYLHTLAIREGATPRRTSPSSYIPIRAADHRPFSIANPHSTHPLRILHRQLAFWIANLLPGSPNHIVLR